MQLKDIMGKHPEHLSPTATLTEACRRMLEHDYGFLPIEENNRLVGVVTDRDIAVRGIAKGLDSNAQLKQVMTKDVITAHEEDDLLTAAKIMEEKQIRRLVVLNKSDEIAGVVSLGDIATKCDELDLCGEIIRAVSKKNTAEK